MGFHPAATLADTASRLAYPATVFPMVLPIPAAYLSASRRCWNAGLCVGWPHDG